MKRIEAKSPGAELALIASGLGNHVQVIEILAGLARAQRAAAKA